MDSNYAREGWQIFRQAIPTEMVEEVRQIAYILYQQAGGKFGTLGAYTAPDGRQYHARHILPRYEKAKALLSWLPLHGIFAPGVQLAITHSKFSYKIVGEDWTWQPHQDAAYKPEPRYGATFAIPLEPMSQDNGTLEIGQRLSLVEHHAVGEQLQMEIMPGSLTTLEMSPGDVAVFSLYNVHRSLPNKAHGLRAILFIEVEPYTDSLTDDLGGKPIVI